MIVLVWYIVLCKKKLQQDLKYYSIIFQKYFWLDKQLKPVAIVNAQVVSQ